MLNIKTNKEIYIENIRLSPGQQAKKTGQWAKTMTKWLITYSTKVGKKWHFVSFEGAKGGESRGIVDFIAIRRDHKYCEHPLKIGDLFEIILIQVKGGSASMPTTDEVTRLLKVGEYYKAKKIILSYWQKGKPPTFYWLTKKTREKITPNEAFS